MRLVPQPYVDREDLIKLRPQIGDTVIYEGVQYVVEQVGLKYVTMYRKDNPRVKGMAKMNEVVKYFEPEVENVDPRQQLGNLEVE